MLRPMVENVMSYSKQDTGLLLVDPYNDFLSEGGKLTGLANTCIEATSRFAAELGYHETLVRDATAAFSEEALHAAHEINGPTLRTPLSPPPSCSANWLEEQP